MSYGGQWGHTDTVSLIKNKSNEELWGTIVRFRGNAEVPRHRTRIGYLISRKIDNFHILAISPTACDILRAPSRDIVNERDYCTERTRAFVRLRFGRYPAKNYIMERCITFEGGRSVIPREHRKYRMSDKPIGK